MVKAKIDNTKLVDTRLKRVLIYKPLRNRSF